MKILHCISQLPEKTGSGVYFKNILDCMEEKGYENAALYAVQEPFDIKLGVKNYPVRFLKSSLDFPIPGMSDVMPYQSTIYSKMTEDMLKKWKEAFLKALKNAREEFDPDIIITHHIFMLSNLVAEVFPDKKKICICHGTDIRQVLKHDVFLKFHMKNIKDMDRFLCVSSGDCKKIEEIFSLKKESIISLGAGFDNRIFFDRKREKKDFVDIAYAGKIAREKGVFELVTAIRKLNEKMKNLRFHIIGNSSGDEREILKKSCSDIKNIVFVDALSQRELGDYLGKTDIFVLPSYYESLGLVAIEALACGNLVVSTYINGLYDLLGEEINSSGAIRYVSLPRLKNVDMPYREDLEKFSDSLFKNIQIQINSLKEKDIIFENIREKISSFSWEKISEKIEEQFFN